MQTACWEMPWFRALRAVALMLAVVLGLEWTVPLGGYAQPNQGSPSRLPRRRRAWRIRTSQPIQEAESAEAQSPVYKKWWFWVLVVVGVGVGFLVAVIAIAASDGIPVGPGP